MLGPDHALLQNSPTLLLLQHSSTAPHNQAKEACLYSNTAAKQTTGALAKKEPLRHAYSYLDGVQSRIEGLV